MMKMDLTRKKALVTGGTRGIGLEIAKSFLQAGAEVTVGATSKKDLDSAYKFIQVDFSDLNSTLKFTENEQLGEFDILVNNAGINIIDSLTDIALEDWQKVQDVNLRAPFLVSQSVARGMIQRKSGRIINISSIFGLVTREKRLSYTTTKSGIIGMTRTMALELAAHGILVNCISPGFIDTDLTRANLTEAEIKDLVSKVPLKKLGSAKDIANLALFLVSDLNLFMTGENIVLDGGFTCA